MTFSEMADENTLRPFLLANRAEVKRMCITEYDEARTFAEQREEGRAEGRAEGREEGREEGRAEERVLLIRNVMANLKTSADKAMDILGIPAAERSRYLTML